MARLKELFTSRHWYELIPDAKHELVVDGLGEFTGLDYLAAARTEDRVTVIAYMPSLRTFTVNTAMLSGKMAKAWYNPRTGTATGAGEYPTTGRRQFTPPGEGDWVLVLDHGSKNLPAPGRSI